MTREYPSPEDIRAFEAEREEDAALDASLATDPRGLLDYEGVEGGACDDDASGFKELEAA